MRNQNAPLLCPAVRAFLRCVTLRCSIFNDFYLKQITHRSQQLADLRRTIIAHSQNLSDCKSYLLGFIVCFWRINEWMCGWRTGSRMDGYNECWWIYCLKTHLVIKQMDEHHLHTRRMCQWKLQGANEDAERRWFLQIDSRSHFFLTFVSNVENIRI